MCSGLLGLTSLLNMHACLDLRDVNNLSLEITAPHGRQKLNLVYANGHLLLPIDDFGNDEPGAPLPTLENFKANPLGVKTFFLEDEKTNSSTCAAEQDKPDTCSTAVQTRKSQIPKPKSTDKVKIRAEPQHDQNISRITRPLAGSGRMYRIMRRAEALLQSPNASWRMQKKYAGLPPNTPPPEGWEKLLHGPQWDFWEWWAGSSNLTREALNQLLSCGPPIDYDILTGWDMNNKSHQNALECILKARRPRVLFGAPCCSIWSNSNTTTPENVKKEIRDQQMSGLKFFRDKCREQVSNGWGYLLENPRSSELLRIEIMTDLFKDPGCYDNLTDMCCHKLRDPYSNMPHKKPTTIRGTIKMNKTSKLCDGTHSHQMLQGKLPDGRSRTSVAAEYTRPFCRCVVKDVMSWLAEKGGTEFKAFPVNTAEDDSVRLEEDGYEDLLRELQEMDESTPAPATPGRVRGRDFLEPTSKAMAKPKAQPQSDPDPWPPVKRPQRTSQRRLPYETKEKSTSSSSSSSGAPPAAPPAAAPQAAAPTLPAIPEDMAPPPGLELAVPAAAAVQMPKPLVPVYAKELNTEDKTILTNLLKQAAPRTGDGGIVAISKGPRLRLLQDMFGTPHGIIVKLGIIGRRPAAVPHPEPLLAREAAHKMCVIIQLTEAEIDDSVWHVSKWIPCELRQFKGNRAKPPWVIVPYGQDRSDSLEDVLAIRPVEQLVERQEAHHDLPAVLKTLAEGTQEEKLKLLLSLHKRFYHKPADALRSLLNRSGVPMRTLSLVADACKLCDICRRWTPTGTKPTARTSLATSFNDSVYADLVLFDDGLVYLFLVDEAIRYLVVTYVEGKTFEKLETAVRRAWIYNFGPPKQIISDKEGSLAGEAFGQYCDKVGIKRVLYTAGDNQHARLAVLDRRVRLFREMAPRLADTLAMDSALVDPEDIGGECQLAINLLPVAGGHCPYECLYGVPPNDVLDIELDTVASISENTLPFYKHQLCRVRATQALQEAILQSRVNRTSRARPRTENAMIYSVGTEIDIYKRTTRKDLSGWRGPAVVVAVSGEGMVTVRWQGQYMDVLPHMCRPHQALMLRRIYLTNDLFAGLLHNSIFATLAGLASQMQTGSHQLHYQFTNGSYSRDAERDQMVVLNLGKRAAEVLEIKHYRGVGITRGRRYLETQQETISFHVLHWQSDPMNYVYGSFDGKRPLDLKLISQADNVSQICAIIFHEGHDDTPSLPDLVDQKVPTIIDGTYQEPVRVRTPFIDDAKVIADELSDKIAEFESARSEESFQSATSQQIMLSSQLGVYNRLNHIDPPFPHRFVYDAVNESIERFEACPNSLEGDSDEDEETGTATIYAVEKELRALSPEELKRDASQVEAACLKELQSWLQHDTGRAELTSSYSAKTGLRPLPSRWVIEYKMKNGLVIVKARLCAKGFAERNQHELQTSSPTATRLGHKMIFLYAAYNRSELWSLDVGTAFLQGWTLDTVNASGHKRQACALTLPTGCWSLVAKLDKEIFQSGCRSIQLLFDLEQISIWVERRSSIMVSETLRNTTSCWTQTNRSRWMRMVKVRQRQQPHSTDIRSCRRHAHDWRLEGCARTSKSS